MAVWTVDGPEQLTFNEVGVLRVNLVGGTVNIVGAEGSSRLEVSKVTSGPLQVVQAGAVLTVGYDDLSWSGLFAWLSKLRRSAEISLAVPRDCTVEIGVVHARAVISDLDAPVTVRNVSGEVTLNGVGGVKVETVSGDIVAQGVDGPVEVTSVSGEVTVVRNHGGAISANSVSGAITVDVETADEPPSIRLTSVSGEITVRLPPGCDATIDLSATGGSIGSAFDLAEVNAYGHRRLAGMLGSGTGTVNASTVGSNVSLLCRDEQEAVW